MAGPLAVVARRRWSERAVRVRRRLVELSRHPAAVASVSAATTVGGAVLVNALRHAARAAAAPPAASGPTVIGYILHEVHVFHHVVARDDPHRSVEIHTGQW